MTGGRLHFIGIGGAGMSAVAWLAHRGGAAVSGTDAADGPYLRALREAGVDARMGHDPGMVEGADAVVVTSAVREGHPEVENALARGIPVLHRSEALARVLGGRVVVAVAGSHDKTTTAAMCAHALHASGIDASFAIGATVLGVDGAVGGAYAGTSDVAVIEADESDGSFLAYSPTVAVLTNVEADHLDHFGSREAVEAAFVAFASSAGRIVVCGDDEGATRVAEAAAAVGAELTSYGWHGPEPRDVRVDEHHLTGGGARYPLVVAQPGRHNRLNVAGAWSAAVAVGAEPGAAADAMATYAGTGRRYEFRGEADGVRVIDDYAHHPTEIAALLDAARERESGALVVLFQPHLYSRTRLLAREFADALSAPGVQAVIAGVYGAREDPEPGVDASTIADLAEGRDVEAVEDLRDAASRVVALARRGDTILTVGAGSVTYAAAWILDELAARVGSP